MREPDFNILSLPDMVVAEVDGRIEHLREEVQRRNAEAMIEPLRRLTRIRGNFPFDLISSLAWAAEAVCGTAVSAGRQLNSVEARSLVHAIDSMDRARRTALLAVAV
jgi:hypothetical protein